ncbi:hypothetical protein [Branchiibius sp. NY16-3462-2]|uniref:carboxymuconolactone decarboxylase family protein n=1 Tax=Branchiibius sp. NY16-3462-2 TaxID=1807500 RepID=UPI0007986E7C|nr:hypothetical protein [Branchiibius sp. NY16-3462-2]KYH44933.1 hypothetical protein AZH51_13590 [Branchiibius sp. NY16-3462-2]
MSAADLGGRLPLADPVHLDPAQRDLYDHLMSTWVKFADSIGVQAATEDKRLIGPFNALLLHPELATSISDLQVAESAGTTLSPRIRQIAILLTGGVWRADYELYAQFGQARELGFSEEEVIRLCAGEVPESLVGDEHAVAEAAWQLATKHRVDDDAYSAAVAAVGPEGLFDLCMVMGVYHAMCSLMALFEVPAP